MKRRDLLQMTPGAVLGLSACSSKDALASLVSSSASGRGQSPLQSVKMPANTQYRPPAYANQGLRNPNMNLPTAFSGSAISYSRGSSAYANVAMTFDDGPHPTNTPRLFDMLRKRNIRATVYVIG